MKLYLVQHGRSLPKEADPERGLSAEGAEEVRMIAGVAKHYAIRPAAIVHSGKKRSRETAEIMAGALEPPGEPSVMDGIAPLDDVTAAAPAIEERDGLMVVGHLPFLGRLTSLLVTGTVVHDIFTFQHGGIVCLGRDGDSGLWSLRWSLSPRIGRED